MKFFTMEKKLLVILLFYSIHLNIVQSKIQITFKNVEASVSNPEYLSDYRMHINDNKNGININFTLIKDAPDPTQMSYKLHTLTMGQWGPAETLLDADLCAFFKPPFTVIGKRMESIGIAEDNCFPSAGTYGTANLEVPADELPEGFPPNDYLAVFTVSSEEEVIMEMKFYFALAIENPLKFG